MKIIWTDNYNRDHIPDRLIASGITSRSYGEAMVEALRAKCGGYDSWFELVDDNYRLKEAEL